MVFTCPMLKAKETEMTNKEMMGKLSLLPICFYYLE